MSLESTNDETFEEGLDLHQYFSLFWHWSWLIALVAVVAGVAAYIVSKQMTPYYRSTTTVMVNEAPAARSADYTSLILSEQLTSTYSEMMVKDPVLSEVISQLNLSLTTSALKDIITAAPIRDTQLMLVSAETTDPQLSADIANTVATVFSRQLQEIQSQRFGQSKASLETQLTRLEEEITVYETQASEATSTDEKERLDSKVTQYREIYSGVLQSYEAVRLSEAQSVSSVVQVETAMAATQPTRPQVIRNTLLAFVVGIMLSAGVIVARDALDDTIKTPEDISGKFKLPILGVINHYNGKDGTPITLAEPRSPTAEAYRTLRTNISYASVDKPLKTLMVTSAEAGEGKTTTLSNLAVAMAQNGKQVIVADCDLRHPHTHINFRLNNRKGMSNLFGQSTYVLDGTCQPSEVENLSVVTTGVLPPNPAELLGSRKMQSILAAMTENADIVLIDTPPALAVTDAAVLAPTLDGVLLVVRPGKTRARALEQTVEQMRQVGAKVIGVVLNDVMTGRTSYGYRYKYYRNYAAYQEYYGHKKKKKKR